MTRSPLLRVTSAGIYCEQGGFHIDPWHPVARAVVTHAHADHYVAGCRQYVTARSGRGVLQQRLPSAVIQPLDFGETLDCFGVKVSLHPAGHILGSAQVRVEHQGEIWVASGDYKVHPDVTCTPFEPIRCHAFITESTFGHPFFAWEEQQVVFQQIHDWWRENQARGEASWLYAYSLGKAQRLLAGLDATQGPIFAHEWVAKVNAAYRNEGVVLPETRDPVENISADDWGRSLFVLPPNQRWQTEVVARGPYRSAFVSGWMAMPNGPRQRRVERGFALSDHADHHEILAAIAATGAERVFVTHGYIDVLTECLCSTGIDAQPWRTPRCGTPPAIPATQREFEF